MSNRGNSLNFNSLSLSRLFHRYKGDKSPPMQTMEKRRLTSVDRTPSIGPRTPLIVHHQASAYSAVDSSVSDDSLYSNSLLHDFDFPPFDSVDAKNVRPRICALLQQLVCFPSSLPHQITLASYVSVIDIYGLIDFVWKLNWRSQRNLWSHHGLSWWNHQRNSLIG